MLSSTFLPRDWLPVATCEEYEKNPVIVPPSEPDPFHTYETYIAGWILSGLFTVFATCSSLYLIYGHLTHYRIPEIQRPINRILLMVPVYAIISFLSYRFISYAVFFNVIRDCYEGFVIWCFFGLLLQYLGPDMNAQRAILASKSRRRLPPPACCFKHDPSWRHFLNLCKLGIMQYVIVRISTTILAVVLEINNAYCPESMSPSFGHFWATILNALSVGLAMFTLFAFYLAVHHDLSSGARRVGSSAHPVAQFLSIKFVVFFGFWQGFIVKLLVAEGILHATEDWTAAEVSTAVQSFFVCFEMAIASGLHLWAFAWRDFDNADSPSGSVEELVVTRRDRRRKRKPNAAANPLAAMKRKFSEIEAQTTGNASVDSGDRLLDDDDGFYSDRMLDEDESWDEYENDGSDLERQGSPYVAEHLPTKHKSPSVRTRAPSNSLPQPSTSLRTRSPSPTTTPNLTAPPPQRKPREPTSFWLSFWDSFNWFDWFVDLWLLSGFVRGRIWSVMKKAYAFTVALLCCRAGSYAAVGSPRRTGSDLTMSFASSGSAIDGADGNPGTRDG